MSRMSSPVEEAFRAAVTKRDGRFCRGCGGSGLRRANGYRGTLAVHRIREDISGGGYVVENGIMLCPGCTGNAERAHENARHQRRSAMDPASLYALIGSSHEDAEGAARVGMRERGEIP